jgi:hypothetical protein
MRNRHWICYALDILGIIGLGAAVLALASGLWFAGSTAEGMLVVAFRLMLGFSLGAFMLARSLEIYRLLMADPHTNESAVLPAENVEVIANRRLKRAA